MPEGMTTDQLELELREIKVLAGAALAAVVQMNWGKVKDRTAIVKHFRQQADDDQFLLRWFAEPRLGKLIGENPARALRNAPTTGATPPFGGYYTLAEIAAAGRDTIAGIKGVGKKSMDRLDAALGEHEMTWADTEAVTV